MSAEAPSFAPNMEANPLPGLRSTPQGPTERQLFFRDMYRTGKLSPYQKDRPTPKFDAWKNAMNEALHDPVNYVKHFGDHVMAVDMDLRGGADKEYNQLGDMGHRAKRMGVMVANMAPAIALDVATSIPSNLLKEAVDRYLEINIKGKNPESKYVRRLVNLKAGMKGLQRMFEIMNDKNLTSVTNVWVRKLTGEKGEWIDEANDKLGDLLDAAANDWMEDFVNGSVSESFMRIVYDVPVVGALWEQVWSRLSMFMRSSQFIKGNMKGVFMGIGFVAGVMRGANDQERKSPSMWIANKIWSQLRLGLDRRIKYNFFDFVDKGKAPRWMGGYDTQRSIWDHPPYPDSSI